MLKLDDAAKNTLAVAAVISILLALAFWAGWTVHANRHSDDVCDFARESYESVMSQPEDTPYMARLEGHVLARYVIACGNEYDIQALKDEYFLP